MSHLVRTTYCVLLRLHPQEFRAEFGREMLWIFDEEMYRTDRGLTRARCCAQLLLDLLRSAIVQRALRKPQKTQAPGLYLDVGASGTLNQVAQTTFIIVACLCSVLSITVFFKMLLSRF